MGARQLSGALHGAIFALALPGALAAAAAPATGVSDKVCSHAHASPLYCQQ